MDDLTTLKGIGKATEKKLHAAGINSYSKLAGATPDLLNAAQVAGGPTDWAAMIAEAAKLAPAPVRQLTAEEVAALVKSWDAARSEMKEAGDLVATLQYQLDTIEPDTDRTQLDLDLAEAKARTIAAQTTIEALMPLPEGVRLPDAHIEIPAGSQASAPAHQAAAADQGPGEGTANDAPLETGAVASASDSHTPQSDDGHDGGASNLAGAAAQDLAEFMASEEGDVLLQQQIDGVIETARNLAADGYHQAALDHLASERANAAAMMAMAQRADTAFAAELHALSRSATCWPLQVVRYDGEDRPIGKPFAIKPDVMATLVAAGVVADRAPTD